MFVWGCVGILDRKKRPSMAETLTMNRQASAGTGGASSPRIDDVVREGAAAGPEGAPFAALAAAEATADAAAPPPALTRMLSASSAAAAAAAAASMVSAEAPGTDAAEAASAAAAAVARRTYSA